MKPFNLSLVACVLLALSHNIVLCCGTWEYATMKYPMEPKTFPVGTGQANVTYGQEEYKYKRNASGGIIDKTYTDKKEEITDAFYVPTNTVVELPDFEGTMQHWDSIPNHPIETNYTGQ